MPFHNPLSLVPQNAVPLAQRSIAFGSVTTSYTPVGATFGSSIVLLFIISTFDQTVQMSFDGVTDFIPVLPNSTITIDFRSDSAPLPANYGVFVKEIGNPASGNLYVSAISV